MARFLYTVQDSQGMVTTGALDADDEDGAVQSLQTKGLFILSIQSEDAKAKGILSIRKYISGRISGREMVFFGEQMSTLIGGGIPLVRALSLLSEHGENKNLCAVLGAITNEVSSGGSFHKALEKHPKVFDEIWVSLVQAGEVSGQLPAVLRQITAYSESQENIKSKIITAVAYPAVLLTMASGVLIYFVMFIVPVFAGIFNDFHLKLPPLTATILAISDILGRYIVLVVVSVIGAVFGAKAYVSTPPGRLTWNHIQLNMPLFGSLIRSMQIERLLTTMATLIRSGVSILNAVSVLEGAFGKNLIYQTALRKAKNDIASGRSISESFKKTAIFPPMVTEMIWMGEESGKLPDIIVVLSKYYQEQIDQWLRRFSSMIDPILVVGVGGLVGVIVMSIFLPIFQLSRIGT